VTFFTNTQNALFRFLHSQTITLKTMSLLRNNKYLVNSLKYIRDYKSYLVNYRYIHKTIPKQYHPIPTQDVIDYNFARFNGPQKYLCFAPFNSMFFDIRGKVVVCNQNRDYIIGDVNEQTLHDIWFGDKRRIISEHIAHHDFNLGCQKCADAILSKNYNGLPAISYDYTPTIERYPARLEFEISSTCNLACVMCNGFISSTYRKHFEQEEAYPSVYRSSFAEQLTEFIPHLKYTKFSGGEPFLIDLYYDIWSKMIELNPACGIHVQTNGLVLNNKVKNILEKGRFYIGVSLDGASRETYENIRLFGKFDRVLENLYYFKDYCERKKTELNIPFTPTIKSMYEVHRFADLANTYNATAFFNVVWEPHAIAIWTLDSPELKALLAFYEKQHIASKTYTEHKNKMQFEYFKNQVRKWIKDAEERERLYPQFEQYSNEELINQLTDKLIAYDKGTVQNWFTGEIQKDPVAYYHSIFYKKLNEKPDEIRRLLIKMSTYDVERIHIDVNNFFHLH
jgi:MoaA/NifB/PqqE/SkfB family radical SAM enzyme